MDLIAIPINVEINVDLGALGEQVVDQLSIYLATLQHFWYILHY